MYDDDDSSWLGDVLLGWEGRQHRDIQRLKAAASDVAVSAESAIHIAQRLVQRVDRLELLCEALVELVVARKIATREELGVLVAQVDLRDGVEDGSVGSQPRRSVPACGACGRPVNPQRPSCVYCGAAVVVEAAAPAATVRPVRTVTCGGCGETVDERESNFTEHGLRCDRCFAAG
ncbi:MAG: hypothetical protein R3A79_20790 [Nannocystaceae bacterium]